MAAETLCKTCQVPIAKKPMPHLGFGTEPMWVHVETISKPKATLLVETYYRTCMSSTFAAPENEE